MKLFVDTGNVKEIEALAALGILDGVTTNPSLLAKVGGDPRVVLKRICDVVQGPVSAEVVATDGDGMVREGRELAAIDPHKDADGLHPHHLGLLLRGTPHTVPATPAGVQQMLLRSGYDPGGKRVVIGHLEQALPALRGEAGTQILADDA